MSRHPETDNLARGNHVVPTEWEEQLERERDEARMKLKDMEAERDYARTKATNAWEAYTKLDTENRRLERKLEELRLAYNEAVAEPPLKFKRIT
jgi:chromosome segregation ATPase